MCCPTPEIFPQIQARHRLEKVKKHAKAVGAVLKFRGIEQVECRR